MNAGVAAVGPKPARILILYEDSRVAVALAARTMDIAVVELARLADLPALQRAREHHDLVLLCPALAAGASSGHLLPVPASELPPILVVTLTRLEGLHVSASTAELRKLDRGSTTARTVADWLLNCP